MELILGAFASLLTQVIKKYFGTSGVLTFAALAAVAVVLAAGYHILAEVGWLNALRDILITAGAFYAFILSNVSK